MPLFQKSPRANEFDLHENRASKQNWFRMETRFDRKANSISKNGLVFYHNSTNCRTLIGSFLSSISGQTHEFIIYATRQQAREDNLTVCYGKKQVDVSFSCVGPVIDNEFRHNIVKILCGSTWLSPRGSTATLTMLCEVYDQ